MKKVLIAIDYDPTAQKVAEKGYLWAKTMEAEVILLHVIAEAAYYSVYGILEAYPSGGIMGINEVQAAQLFDKDLKTAMTRYLNKVKIHLGDENIKVVVKEGVDFGDIILQTAQKLKVDVIVMGTHSRKWLENILLGSATNDVLRKSTIPLFIIPIKNHK